MVSLHVFFAFVWIPLTVQRCAQFGLQPILQASLALNYIVLG